MQKYDPDAFGRRLRTLRVRAGLSQQQLADGVSGLNQSSISAMETGTLPRVDDVVALAGQFDVTLEYLIGLSDHPTPLPPGSWLIDDDALEACLAGTPPSGPGELWAVAIPERHRVVSSPEYARLAAKVAAVVSGVTPRKKPRKK